MHNIKCAALIILKVHNIKYTVTVDIATEFHCKPPTVSTYRTFCGPKQKLLYLSNYNFPFPFPLAPGNLYYTISVKLPILGNST